MENTIEVSKNWLSALRSIVLAVVILVIGRTALAGPGQPPAADPQNGRVYKNLFEYRMCVARDSNWCSTGDNFEATLFDRMYLTPTLGSDPAYFWESGSGMVPHYPTATLGTLTRYTADFCEAGLPNLSGQCPAVHDQGVVRCLDGTRPLFYYEAGEGADANKWIFKVQGGSYQCADNCPNQILVPNIRSHYSSAYSENPASRPAPGIFSDNDDNAFRDYNIVQLDKCVGDRNQGATTYTDFFTGVVGLEDGTGPVYFHGYRVILATLRRLKRDFNLADAEHVLFVTQSNGTNGAYHYIDRLSGDISATLGITAPVYLLAQSWILPGPEVEYFFENGSWPVIYTDIPTSTETSPGIINAPDTSPTAACGPGFDALDPYYSHWILEGRKAKGGELCDPTSPVFANGGAHGRPYATDDFQNGNEATYFRLWGVDNGDTVTWDQSCVEAHAGDPDLRACRDSRHVFSHHLQTPVFFAAQAADRNLRALNPSQSVWSPQGIVWSPQDMKLRVEKLAEVISGAQDRSNCADDDLGRHGFFIDNTVDHMSVSEMSKLTRPMKANSGTEEGFNFQLQQYLMYWLHPSAPSVQCLDSNELYDVEFTPPNIDPLTPPVAFPVNEWPPLVHCQVGYYLGGGQPYQACDDPGFGDPSDPDLNKADERFVCQGPPILEYIYLPLVMKTSP